MSLYPGRWRALLLRLCSPSCSCPTPGKNPHVEGSGWQQQALARFEGYSEQTAEAHATRVREHVRRGGNVGLAVPPFACALDVDTDLDGGSDFTQPLARDAALALLDGHPVQQSGKADGAGRRVGVHVWGTLTEERAYGTHYGNVPVTIRHVGNQVAVAPSIHASGLRYEWLVELPEDPALLPTLDATLFRHVPRSRGAQPIQRDCSEDLVAWRQRNAVAWRADLADPEVIFEPGRRHEALLWQGWALTVDGASEAETLASLWDLAVHRCKGGGRFTAQAGTRERRVLEQELRAIVRSCRRRYAGWRAAA